LVLGNLDNELGLRRAISVGSGKFAPESPVEELLFLAEEEGSEVDRGGLERRRPFSRGTEGLIPDLVVA
jgi:hypothetical protein